MDDNKEPKEEPTPYQWDIPICCVEGWESCRHVLKPPKKKKTNIGL